MTDALSTRVRIISHQGCERDVELEIETRHWYASRPSQKHRDHNPAADSHYEVVMYLALVSLL